MLDTETVEFWPLDQVHPRISKNEVSLGHAKQDT